MNISMSTIKNRGFTVVELLIVIVVIGILAVITVVSYTGVQKRAIAASIVSDLDSFSKKIKLYYSMYSEYPTLGADYCPTSPVVDNNYCLKVEGDFEYYVNNDTNPESFCILNSQSSQTYSIANNSSPLNEDCLRFGLVLDLDAGNVDSYPGSGLTWTDLSGLNNDGTLINGVSYDVGNSGALNFDGSNDYVAIPHSNSFDVESMTIAMWIRTSDTMGTLYRALFSKQGATRDYNLYARSDTSTDISTLHFSSNEFGGSSFGDLPALYNPYSWHFVSIAIDNTGLQEYYSDGLLIDTYQGSPGFANNSYPILIGSANNFWKGLIGSVQFYNRALDADEISDLFNKLSSRYGF